MEQLSDLRKRVEHAEKLAGRKISRMAKAKNGYDVRGTNLDPIKPTGWIKRATRAQLTKYLADLDYFRRPSVGWVSDMNGNPIKRQVVKNLEAASRKRNRDIETIEGRIAGIEIPWAGQNVTVGSYRKHRLDSKRRLRQNNEQNVRVPIKERWNGKSLSSEAAAHRYAQKNRRMFSESQFRADEKKMRGVFKGLIELADDYATIAAELDRLSPEQFWLAWSSSPHLAASAALVYEILFKGAAIPSDVLIQETESIHRILKQASAIEIKTGAFWV